MTATTEPLFAAYSPAPVLRVSGVFPLLCTAATCVRETRKIGRGGEYVVMDRTTKFRGRAEHLDCNVAAQEALLKQAQLDASAPPIVKGEPLDLTRE